MKKLIYCLIGIMACGSVMGQGASSPESWQFGTASTRDIYYGGRCDTVITRTCGHSVTVTAARMIDEQNHVLNHRFFVRCMNGQNYFRFDILPSEHSIMPTYTVDRRYHIHDMRISDSICFFCGTKITVTQYPPEPGNPESSQIDEVSTIGFFGRFDFGALLRDSNAMYIPGTDDPNGSEAPIGGGNPSGLPVPVTEWYPSVYFALIPQTSALEKMWVENGIFVEGYQYGHTNKAENSIDPYTDISVSIDPNFDITTAHAYIIGRLAEDPNRSCLMEVTQGLRYDGITDTWFDLYEPEMPEERLTDVTGNDYRILFSSRIFKDIEATNETTFDKDFTIGVRYKDNFYRLISDTIDSSYLRVLDLYSHQNNFPNNPLGDDEYGHLFRMKNYHYRQDGPHGEEVYPNRDFGMIFTGVYKTFNIYSPGYSSTIIRSIDAAMNENVALKIGDVPEAPNPNYAGGYKIADVAYIGNTRMNSIAVAYKTDGASGGILNNYYIEQIDFGFNSQSGDYISGGLDRIFKITLPFIATSLDVFLKGVTFQMGGYVRNTRQLNMAVQHKNSLSAVPAMSCYEVQSFRTNEQLTSMHDRIPARLIHLNRYFVGWERLQSITATKHDVANHCTRIKKTIK